MTTLTERRHAGDFIISVASGNRSFENGTLLSGLNLGVGTVVALDGNNKLIAFDGTQDSGGGPDLQAEGILLYDSDASAGDLAVAYHARDAEVNVNLLTYAASLAETVASLKRYSCGIVAR